MKLKLPRLIVLAAAFFAAVGACASGADVTNVVRCARYEEYGFCMRQADGSWAGANVALVDRIAAMNGWQVDWVDCSSAEAVEMLADGRLDLVPGLSYTEARAKRFFYPPVPMLDYGAELVVHAGSGLDLQTCKRLKRPFTVATGGDAHLNGHLENELKGLGIAYRLDRYPSFAEARRMFYLARADAVLTLGPFDQKDERTLLAFPPMPGYVCVVKNRTDLQLELNQALFRLREDEPSLRTDLVRQYFSNFLARQMALTPEERTWLRARVAANEPIRVDLSPVLPPLKLWDIDKKAPRGFVKALFAEISRRTGLTFTFLEPGTVQTARARFQAGQADVWVDFGSLAGSASVDAAHRVEVEASQLVVCRRDSALADPTQGKLSIPAWDRVRLADYRSKGYGSRLVVCRDSLDAVQAVRDGRVDATLLSPLLALTIIRQLDAERDLEARVPVRPQRQVGFSMAVSPQAPAPLAGILKKTAGGLASEDLAALMLQASHESIRRPFLSTRGWIVVVCLGVAVILCLVGVMGLRQAGVRERSVAERERLRRLRDSFFERAAHELSGPIDAIEARAEYLRTPNASREQVLQWTESLIRTADDLVERLRKLVEYARLKREYADKWRQAGGGTRDDEA